MREKLPWEEEYKVFGIPGSFEPYPDRPVYDTLERTARKFKKMGLVQLGYEISYPEVLDHVKRLAHALNSMGINKGDRIATLLPTSVQFIIADFAISRCGAVHIPCSHLEPPDSLEHKFADGGPIALICLDEHLNLARTLKKRSNIKHIILTKLNDYSADIPCDYESIPEIWMKDMISGYSGDFPEFKFDVEKDLETLLFTGGTTGKAKGCMLTHRNIYSNTIQNTYALGAAEKLLEGAICSLMGLPFFHSYGHCLMHTITALGHRQLLIPDPRDTAGMVAMIKKYYPMLQIGVPAQFLNLMKEELEGIGLLAISGSAALPASTQAEFEKKSGGGIMEGYGLSEMSPVTHLNITLLLRIMGGRVPVSITSKLLRIPGIMKVLNFILRLIGSKNIGRVVQKAIPMLIKSSAKKDSAKSREKRGTIGIPFPDTQIKIFDVDSGRELTWKEVTKEGKTGEMCLNGPQRMLGYWPDAGSGMDKEGFVHTGDVVRVDEKGYFSVVDRTKDMIVVSGYKVYSREIDEILFAHPAVRMAATVGVPDPEKEGSERVAVMIQPEDGYKNKITEEEIIKFLREKVAKYAVPKMVLFIDEMPLTEVQKVNKKAIREIIKSRLNK